MTIESICPVCGGHATEGFMRHPVCENCLNDKEKTKIWLRQVATDHPYEYSFALSVVDTWKRKQKKIR